MALFCTSSIWSQSIKCKVNRDVWLSSYQGKKPGSNERNFNMGAATTIKLKSYQEFGLLDFDVSALKGKKIDKAYLWVKTGKGFKFGLNGGTDLRWVSISTVSHNWVEGQAKSYALDKSGFGATFNESSYSKENWGFEGAKVYDVILGNGNSLLIKGELIPKNGLHRIELDKKLVQALVAKSSHGLMIMDGNCSWIMGCTIKSKESGKGPFLEIFTGGEDITAPKSPKELKSKSAVEFATEKLGAIDISFKVPEDTFSFNIKINGKNIDRWQIPFAKKENSSQTITIVDQVPNKEIKIEVQAVDASGNASTWVSTKGNTSVNLASLMPKLSESDFKPKAGEPVSLGTAKIWAFPEITQIDPVTTEALFEREKDLHKKNAVWDGASSTVRLVAARGEIISFQIGIDGKLDDCKIELSNLSGVGSISNKGVRLFRSWYVSKKISEYAIPLKGSFNTPFADNGIENQKHQSITVDYHIPIDTKAGAYTGKITISAGKEKATLNLTVKVFNVIIPEEIHFNPEMNCYSGPGKAGSKKFKDNYRLAHYHRCTINRVPYSQAGRTHSDWIPAVDKKGNVTDWSNFDNNLGGLLDGSWFKDNPRSGVPVPTIYLPFYEGWPLNFKDYYNYGKAPKNTKEKEDYVKHQILADPIEKAISDEYKKAFANCVSQFYAHFNKKGWNNTIAEAYLNNKYNWGYTHWILDEPTQLIDWEALNFFGLLFKKGINDPSVYTKQWHEDLFSKGLSKMNRNRPSFLYRGDISRPAWQGSMSNGIINIMYSSRQMLIANRIVKRQKREMPTTLYSYGSANKPGDNNYETAAWCLNSYISGSDGVLPWSGIKGKASLIDGDKNGLIIDGGKLGHAIASFRIHAFRRGAQDCELLRLLELEKGYSREMIALIIGQKLQLLKKVSSANLDSAGAIKFSKMDSYNFAELKESILKLLQK